jgi:hypothetical protein
MPASKLQIIDYLRQDWDTGFRITTIEQAMHALGLPQDDDLRWQVGQELDDVWRRRLGFRKLLKGLRWLRGFRWRDLFGLVGPSPLRAEVKQWNPASYILTNDEKLVARYILRVQCDTASLPDMAEISGALYLDQTQTFAALRMLDRLGFLVLDSDRTFRLAPDYGRFLQGLGFSFHTVTLQNAEQFNVPCAIDFLLLVSSRYKDQKVVIDDACAHCAERIRIVTDHGALAEVTPPNVYVFQGGT